MKASNQISHSPIANRTVKRLAAAAAILCLAAGWAPAVAGPATQDSLTTIIEKLDKIDAGMRGVTQNWDKVLPANDPGGPCPSSSSRFTCVLGGAAVRDNETGLVWEAAPGPAMLTWIAARGDCMRRTTGGRRGWRLPALHELASLLDPSRTAPALPLGHPFVGIDAGTTGYITESTDMYDGSTAWVVTFYNGYSGLGNKSYYTAHIWCVRGPTDAVQY